MAIAFVQSRSIAGLSLAYTGNVTLGNLLVVAAGDIAGAAVTFTISDSQGNAYSSLPVVDGSGITGASGQLFFALAKATGANTVTITDSAGSPQLFIHEFSGVSIQDKAHSAVGSGLTQDSGPVATTIANELLFGFSFNRTTGGVAFTPGAGWTQAEILGFNALTEYQIVSAAGTYNATTVMSVSKGGTTIWAAQIATFNAPVAAASGDYWLGGRQHETKIILPGYAN